MPFVTSHQDDFRAKRSVYGDLFTLSLAEIIPKNVKKRLTRISYMLKTQRCSCGARTPAASGLIVSLGISADAVANEAAAETYFLFIIAGDPKPWHRHRTVNHVCVWNL